MNIPMLHRESNLSSLLEGPGDYLKPTGDVLMLKHAIVPRLAHLSYSKREGLFQLKHEIRLAFLA